MAVKAASGCDLPVPDFINGAKSYLAEELADGTLDDHKVEEALKGTAVEGEVLKLVGEAYENLKTFMDDAQKHTRKKTYVHFNELMQQVDDGAGGKIWVSNENLKEWKATR